MTPAHRPPNPPGSHTGGSFLMCWGGGILPVPTSGDDLLVEAQGREAHWGPPVGAGARRPPPPKALAAPGASGEGSVAAGPALGGPSLTIFPLFVFLNLGGPNSCRIP